MTPFTRGDLIRRVQRRYPDCWPDSINPIIQGLTDNLRGGAPGAAGKNLLHSVGRGQFVLKSSGIRRPAFENLPRSDEPESLAASPQGGRESVQKAMSDEEGEMLDIGGYSFALICDIEPEREDDGTVRIDWPGGRYNNAAGLPLNKYGTGPFCRFKIPGHLARSGVYAFVVNGKAQYVGECENLSARFNIGYGNISPRNCFIGGQETNCRINNLVLKAVDEAACVALWFYETDDYKLIESKLRQTSAFGWNRA